MSGVDPEITLHQDGPFCYRAQMEYTNDALDAMAQRAAERIEDELVQQLLARLGYVKVVRCGECKYYADHEWVLVTDVCDVCHFWHGKPTKVAPDGYCAWGECREEHK